MINTIKMVALAVIILILITFFWVNHQANKRMLQIEMQNRAVDYGNQAAINSLKEQQKLETITDEKQNIISANPDQCFNAPVPSDVISLFNVQRSSHR